MAPMTLTSIPDNPAPLGAIEEYIRTADDAGGADRVTDTSATRRFASRLGVDRMVVIEGAQHEILIERDVVRAKFWAAFDQFVAGSALKSARREMTPSEI